MTGKRGDSTEVRSEGESRIKGDTKELERSRRRDDPWPTINIRPHIMHFRRLVFSYTE